MDPMTQPQSNLIRKLAGEREVPVAGRTKDEAFIIARYEDALEGTTKFVSKREASTVISWLLELPRDPEVVNARQEMRREAPENLDPGVYEVGDQVYVVRPTRDKQRTYAMKLVVISGDRKVEGESGKLQIDFVYDKGAIFQIKPEHRMPFERAKELTVLYSRCIVCGRHLEQNKSVERGIGPVCIKAFPDAQTATAHTGRKKVVRKVYESDFREVA